MTIFGLVMIAALSVAAAAAAAVPVTPTEHALYADGPDGRFLLDAGWSTKPDPRNVGLREGWPSESYSTGFKPVSVPNTFNAKDFSQSGFKSRVQWYRETFTLPTAPTATGWVLRFESVNRRADVYLNGKQIGSHEGAFLPFELPATGIRPGANVLTVRVDGRMSNSVLPPGNRLRGWWNYGGIQREVYLRRQTALDLSNLQVQATPGATPADPAEVQIDAIVRNMTSNGFGSDYTVDVTGPGGFTQSFTQTASVPPGGALPLTLHLQIPGAHLWSPRDPALYQLVIRAGGQTTSTHFGVRKWSVDATGHALLNGGRLALRGASFHEDVAGRGAALTPADHDKIVRELTDLGANLTREHYPPHPALLEAFDRLGIVYWEQVPVWRLIGGDLRKFKAQGIDLLRQAVMRDRNHASIMTWSVSNETLRGGSAENEYIAAAKQAVKELDTTRLVGADTTLPVASMSQSYGTLDVVGVNEYVGWYGQKPISMLSNVLLQIRQRYPAQALFITEAGAEANRSGPASKKGTYAFQARFLDQALQVADASPDLSGVLIWALRDFPVRPGWVGGNPKPRPPFSYKGIYKRNGAKKPAFNTVRSHFLAVPPVAGRGPGTNATGQ